MAKQTRMYFSFSRATYIFFASALLAQEPQTISGTLTDTNNDPVVQNTILLLKPDGTEHKRTETSKKRLGRGGGKFEFKDVEQTLSRILGRLEEAAWKGPGKSREGGGGGG